MKPTLTSIRARALKQGFTLPIRTDEQWEELKRERNKPLDLTPLLKAYDPGTVCNRDHNWPWEDHPAWKDV